MQLAYLVEIKMNSGNRRIWSAYIGGVFQITRRSAWFRGAALCCEALSPSLQGWQRVGLRERCRAVQRRRGGADYFQELD